MKNIFSISLIICLLVGCIPEEQPLDTASFFPYEKYEGKTVVVFKNIHGEESKFGISFNGVSSNSNQDEIVLTNLANSTFKMTTIVKKSGIEGVEVLLETSDPFVGQQSFGRIVISSQLTPIQGDFYSEIDILGRKHENVFATFFNRFTNIDALPPQFLFTNNNLEMYYTTTEGIVAIRLGKQVSSYLFFDRLE